MLQNRLFISLDALEGNLDSAVIWCFFFIDVTFLHLQASKLLEVGNKPCLFYCGRNDLP